MREMHKVEEVNVENLCFKQSRLSTNGAGIK